MHITKLERAVYELVEAQKVDEARASLYRRELAALRRSGLVERNPDDGSYFITEPRKSSQSGTYAKVDPTARPLQATGTDVSERRAKALKLVRDR